MLIDSAIKSADYLSAELAKDSKEFSDVRSCPVCHGTTFYPTGLDKRNHFIVVCANSACGALYSRRMIKMKDGS